LSALSWQALPASLYWQAKPAKIYLTRRSLVRTAAQFDLLQNTLIFISEKKNPAFGNFLNFM
jgi:hypothetical protein